MECVNLRELFGERYRITHDPAAQSWSEKRDPWVMQIPGQYGTIYPYGGDVLAVEVDYHPGIVRRLLAIPGVTPHQNGAQEKTLLFPLYLFEQVAEVVKPKKKRRLSDEQRQRFIESGRGNRFPEKLTGQT